MLSLRAISEAAISALPDRLTGRASASASVTGSLDIATLAASRAIIVDADLPPVYAVEIYAFPLGSAG